VFTNDNGGTYAGQCKDGYACGLGVATWPSGHKVYAEHGPDGQCDGRCWVRCWADGTTVYILYERGKSKANARVHADGRCSYNLEDSWMYNCERRAPDDPRLLVLIAQVGPVEVRPAAAAPHPLLGPPLRPHAIVRWVSRLVLPPAGAGEDRGHRGAFPCRTLSLVAVSHNPTINRTATHDRAVTRARTDFP
jgi:hypothetical protein